MTTIVEEQQTGVIADMQGPIAYWGPPASRARWTIPSQPRVAAMHTARTRAPRSVARARSRGHWRARRAGT